MRRVASAGQTSIADGWRSLVQHSSAVSKAPIAHTLSELLGWELARENERWRNLQASSSLVQVAIP
jgi:hypothetical protein